MTDVNILIINEIANHNIVKKSLFFDKRWKYYFLYGTNKKHESIFSYNRKRKRKKIM